MFHHWHRSKTTNKQAFIFRFAPFLVPTVLVGIIFATNYTPGTHLTGWDNLHPEFDFKTNIFDRSLFSTWQEYQGLGVRAGNAHAADLIRQIGLWIASLILPQSILRYAYHFLALTVGSFGIYTLTYLLLKGLVRPKSAKTASLVATVFSLLNPGTMQYFAVPYEAFSHFFASFPWLFVMTIRFLRQPDRKSVLHLIVVNILAIPAFYIPTVFLVYLLFLSMLLAFYSLKSRSVIKAAIVFTLTFCLNAHWLLPFLSMVKNGTDFVSRIKINRIFTEEAYLRNQKFGTLPDLAKLKGFLFDTTDLTADTRSHDYLLRPWMATLDSPAGTAFYLLLFAGSLAGYLLMIRKKSYLAFSLLLMFLTALFFLATDNPPAGALFSLLRDSLPVFRQVMRFPFTKFIVPYLGFYAIGLGLLTAIISDRAPKKTAPVLIFIFAVITIWFNLPVFKGYFLYPAMRQQIPDEYFALFDFLKTQDPDLRIANLPQPTFWGWTSYDWGYRGSGFPWYGIRQPVMDRAFDVWNIYNERYYEELTAALYTQKTESAVTDVLDKYRIGLVWFDGRIIMRDKPELLLPDIKSLLNSSKEFEKIFSAGGQTVFRYKNVTAGFTALTDSYSKTIPFLDKKSRDDALAVAETAGALSLTRVVPAGLLSVPSIWNTGSVYFVKTETADKNFILTPLRPKIRVDNDPVAYPPGDKIVIPLPITLPDQAIVILNTTRTVPNRDSWTRIGAGTNYLSVFLPEEKNTHSLTDKFFTLPVNNCISLSDSDIEFGGAITPEKQFTLYAKNAYACMYARLTDLADFPEYLESTYGWLKFSISFRTGENVTPGICLTKEGDLDCFYSANEPDNIIEDNGITTVIYTAPTNNIPLEKIWFKTELAGGATRSTILLTDISVSTFPQAHIVRPISLPAGTGNFSREIPESNLTVELPTGAVLPKYTINPAQIPHEARNCFQFASGLFDRKVLNDDNGHYVKYTAQNASSCDQFDIPADIVMPGTLTTIVTRNIQGRPLKTCLSMDPPGYCLFEDLLDKYDNFTPVQYFTPEIRDTISTNYIQAIDTYAVGNEFRENDVQKITIQSLPYEWLSEITVTSDTLSRITLTKDQESYLPYEAIRTNPTSYTVSIPPQEHSNVMLTLFQSFDPGWNAYLISCKLSVISCKFQHWFPYFFAPRLKEHVLVNNWANGWRLPKAAVVSDKLSVVSSDSQLTTHNSPPTTIVLFFTPQLLQWLGFALLPFPFLIVILKKSKSYRNTHVI